jgi:hypothetical protein
MLSTQNSYKKSKKSEGNVELETLTTFDLYGVSDEAGVGNPPAFLCPPGSIGSLLRPSDRITPFKASIVYIQSLKPVSPAPDEYHGGYFYKTSEFAKFCRDILPGQRIHPFLNPLIQ